MVNGRLIRTRPSGMVQRTRPGISRFRFALRPGMTKILILRSKYPVSARLQADDLAGLQFPIAGGVDLDHGLALAARERDFRALDRAERTDMAHRALQRAGSRRTDLHVVAADKQF